jgi:hypothetical protein
VARLFVEGERYDGLASAAFLEHEYERLVLEHADALFPGFLALPFNKKVCDDEGVCKKPDIALIDPGYRTWWVGEVEMADHPFQQHVLPQVEVLSRARYGPEEADWLADRNPSLDRASLQTMMRGAQPAVAVIVNAPRPQWVDRLRGTNAILMVVEIFRSSRNRIILRQNGAELPQAGDAVSECRVDPAMPRLLIVESPAQLVAAQEPLEIEFGGGITEWTVIQVADRTWLSPVRGNPFPSSSRTFTLVRKAGGRLAFRESSTPRRSRGR